MIELEPKWCDVIVRRYITKGKKRKNPLRDHFAADFFGEYL